MEIIVCAQKFKTCDSREDKEDKMKNKVYKIMFVKNGHSGYAARVTIPMHMLRDLDIKPGSNVIIDRVEEGILIRRCEK